MNRREFLKKIGIGTLITGSGIGFLTHIFSEKDEKNDLEEIKFIQEIINNWDWKKQNFKKKLTRKKFLELRKFYYKYNKKTKEENKEYVCKIYPIIKKEYLVDIIRKKIKENLTLFNTSPEFLFSFIGIEDNKKFENNTIYFKRMHKNLPQIFLQKAEEFNINFKLIFTICLIESSFEHPEPNKSGALNYMQIKPVTIKKVDEYFSRSPKYEDLPKDKKSWREIMNGILNIKRIIEVLNLNINYNNLIDDIDFYILLMCYNQGLDGIIENLNGEFQEEAIKYVKKAKAILSYNWDYTTD